jgi:hypothetical protein
VAPVVTTLVSQWLVFLHVSLTEGYGELSNETGKIDSYLLGSNVQR